MQRVIKIIQWVIIYLVCLEAFMWLGGQGFILVQRIQNRQATDPGVYKIVCLGDSMTALGGEEGYPSQLEKYLNQKAGFQRFKVVNRGIPAADSSKILANINTFIAEEDPDMVTVMMGYNDRHVLNPKDAQNVLDKTLFKLKVARLFRDLFEKLKAQLAVRTASLKEILSKPAMTVPDRQKEVQQVSREYAMALLYAIHSKESGNYSQAIEVLQKLTALNLEESFMDRVWTELAECFWELKDYQKVLLLAARKLSNDPFDVSATSHVRSMCENKREEESVLGMLSFLVQKNPQSIHLHGLLAACYADYGRKNEAEQYFKILKDLRKRVDNVALRENYNKLYKILKERGIKPVFIQYPNLDVGMLKVMFREDYEDIMFIENETNFRPSLDQNKYMEFFVDRRGDEYGHATPYGNYLLASQIGNYILHYLKVKNPQ
jgi:lysophospholipase L1-like esterase